MTETNTAGAVHVAVPGANPAEIAAAIAAAERAAPAPATVKPVAADAVAPVAVAPAAAATAPVQKVSVKTFLKSKPTGRGSVEFNAAFGAKMKADGRPYDTTANFEASYKSLRGPSAKAAK